MKVGVTSSALEYGVTVTALSVPLIVLGVEFTNLMDTVFGNLLVQLATVAKAVGG